LPALIDGTQLAPQPGFSRSSRTNAFFEADLTKTPPQKM
jgi:hypothetical protein